MERSVRTHLSHDKREHIFPKQQLAHEQGRKNTR